MGEGEQAKFAALAVVRESVDMSALAARIGCLKSVPDTFALFRPRFHVDQELPPARSSVNPQLLATDPAKNRLSFFIVNLVQTNRVAPVVIAA